MNVHELKQYIIDNDLIETILESIGCHSIKRHSNYFTASNPDGDNKSAITIYPDLGVVNYTRDIPKPSDILSLVEYNKKLNFFETLKYLHELLGLDLYSQIEDKQSNIRRILNQINSFKNNTVSQEEDTPIKKLDEKVKKYYPVIVNDLFLKDGISYTTQKEFEVSYENESNRIVFPIYTEHGDLISYKGRLFKEKIEDWEQKYLYLYPCPKSKILFGYHKTSSYIRETGKCFIGESEKATMQLWSYGYKNCISLGGKKVSKVQIEKLIRLNVELIFCLDKDVTKAEIEEIATMFPNGISYLWDDNNILSEKESPMDNKQKFEYLLNNHIYITK